jgi:hypothetical protein
MAITILRSPQQATPAHNPIVWEFSSTNTTQANFSFLVELTVNGTVYNYYQVFPEAGTTAKFDASEIARAVVNSPFVANFGLFQDYDNAIATFAIRVREKYGTPPVEQGSWTTITSNVFAFNGALKHPRWIDFDFSIYNLLQTDGALLLTDFPRSKQFFCGLNERVYLSVVNSDQAGNVRAIVSLYDLNGNYINGATPTATSSRINLFDASPQALIDDGIGITESDFAQCYYYEVIFRRQTVSPNNNSEAFRIYVDRTCSRYPTVRLHFLNKLGAWDSFSFNKLSMNNTDVTATHYQRNAGQWSNSNVWTYDRLNGSLMTVAKTSMDTMTVNSDWLPQEVQQWLAETLYESPAVYMEISNYEELTGSPSVYSTYTVFEPVNIVNAKYEKKQSVNNVEIREVIEIKRTYEWVSQLG